MDFFWGRSTQKERTTLLLLSFHSIPLSSLFEQWHRDCFLKTSWNHFSKAWLTKSGYPWRREALLFLRHLTFKSMWKDFSFDRQTCVLCEPLSHPGQLPTANRPLAGRYCLSFSPLDFGLTGVVDAAAVVLWTMEVKGDCLVSSAQTRAFGCRMHRCLLSRLWPELTRCR